MYRVVIVLVITILALAVVGCSGSDESTEMTENSVLPTMEATSTSLPTESPTNTLPVSTKTPLDSTSTASPTNTLPSTASPTNTLPSTASPTNTLSTESVVNTESNLRAGPGTEYDKISIASEGQVVEVIGTNAAKNWYKLASGEWIAASLVNNPPDDLPVVEAEAAEESAPTEALPVSTAPPTNTLSTQSVVNTESNLRAGPSTEYDKISIASEGQLVEVIGTNAAKNWYKLASGEWIAASLVNNPPDDLPVVEAPQVAQEPTEPTPTQAAEATGADVRITGMRRNGSQGENEPDEYVEITNLGDAPQEMSGWRLESEKRGDDTGQIFHFPQGLVMQPSQICRIYTNQDEPEWCGLNFRHAEGAVWSNYDPDAALLYDQARNLVSRWDK